VPAGRFQNRKKRPWKRIVSKRLFQEILDVLVPISAKWL
jgi:hypothetical protein